MGLKDKLGICVLVVMLCGCNKGLMNMQHLAQSQQEAQNYVREQAQLFYKLRDDLAANRIEKGISKQEILSEYSEPIFTKALKETPEIKEVLCFRHPTEFFSSDLIYLYFDKDGHLSSWEVVPATK